MLEDIKYVNHLGESFSNADGIRIKISQLRNYEWAYDDSGTKIRRFNRGLSEREIPLTVMIDPNAEVDPSEAKDKIFEIAEKDVIANVAGRLYVNGYYLSGFIFASEKSGYMNTPYLMQNNLKFLALGRGWIKENTKSFPAVDYSVQASVSLPEDDDVIELELQELPEKVLYPEFPFDYVRHTKKRKKYPEFDFPFDYVYTKSAKHMLNDSFMASNFKLTIFGFALNPEVIINGHVYGVRTTVYSGERIEIDSYNKTVKKIGRLGEVTNIFNLRMKEQSVFEKIPTGSLNISWSESFPIELTLYDERSEPAWS